MKRDEIISQVKKLSKNIKKGDSIRLLYDGKELARYDFIEWSRDSNTPENWITQCVCFDIDIHGRDINKCEIRFVPAGQKRYRVKFHKEVIVEVPVDYDEAQIIEAACDEVTRGDAYVTKEDVKAVIEM